MKVLNVKVCQMPVQKTVIEICCFMLVGKGLMFNFFATCQALAALRVN